ncbi:restriction endonuclease [Streptomyces sp. Wb2n-11]|uniref:restriction endonuclease n=1 Tax=Streptomyces sp. Wb2n-11 TaxID=1030533 RepID=UPI000B09C4DB|nr:restriction endonuclease [Streptomyces sp. Wb2n-11]
MPIPTRRSRTTGRGPASRLRVVAFGLGLVAIVVCGVGLTFKAALGEGDNLPAAVLATAALVVVAAAVVRGGRRRRVRPAAVGADVVGVDVSGADISGADITGVDVDGVEAARDEAGAESAGAGYVEYAAMDPDTFERAIAELCERDGCVEVQVVGGAGDLGADVIAITPDGRCVVIQCKRYGPANKVGSQDVQRFGGTCYAVHGAQVAAVVTTGEFTEPAAEYAEQCGILCIDHQALTAWAGGTGPAPWDQVPVA